MAASLPAALKIKEITPFATRAAQLEKYKPIVSYWCNYYVIDQILAKGLHTTDDECMTYTTTLMDKLEQVKNEQAGNDAITDDVAAKAYIEQFALETFQRADDAIHSDKATRQTIDTFQAASTFLDILNMSIWAPVDPEMTAKSKYAKYHAVRIAKAIKAGEDPNASNPKQPEPPVAGPSMQIDSSGGEELGREYRPPTVESAPESKQPSRPASVVQASPLRTPCVDPPAVQPEHDVSPIEPSSRQGSVGGGYFPAAPTFTSESAVPTMPTAHPILPTPDPTPSSADLHSPSNFYSQPLQPPAQTLVQAPVQAPPPQFANPLPPVQAVPPGGYRTDDDSITLAQKHAKWAQSALNFEDVNTAVKELRLALQSLGAA
ncbi:hypothetical protein MBLNU459_g1761t1 [Dothideomycetes sp. NU459]